MNSNEPMYKKLPVDNEVACSLRDFELTHRVFTNIVLSMQERTSELSVLTEHESTVYFASILDMQVLNGGIDQYFGNYEHRYTSGVTAALRKLQRYEIADRFEYLDTIADQEFEVTERSFKDFNTFYYAASRSKSMDAYLKEYILAHMDAFKYPKF